MGIKLSRVNLNNLILDTILILPISVLFQKIVPWINKAVFFLVIASLIYFAIKNLRYTRETFLLFVFLLTYCFSLFITSSLAENINEYFYLLFFMLFAYYIIIQYNFIRQYLIENTAYLKKIVVFWDVCVIISMFFSSSYNNGFFFSFTGSVATGLSIANRAGMKKVTLELGGNDPLVVLDDADVDEAVLGVMRGAYLNAGQVCMGVKRVIVDNSIADEFAEKEPCNYFFSIPAKKGTITESVNVDKGKYAVLVYHDENSNNRLDMAMFGKPTERYGFSNNKYGAFGSKPPFDEAVINIDKPVTAIIKLRK